MTTISIEDLERIRMSTPEQIALIRRLVMIGTMSVEHGAEVYGMTVEEFCEETGLDPDL